MNLEVLPHPLLELGAFVCELPRPLSEMPSPAWLSAQLGATFEAPMSSDDAVRSAVRDLLRHGGFKPTGRSKPASEYLRNAAEGDGIRSINAAVDACNVASLWSGLPISVVDLDRAEGPFKVAVAPPQSSYIFNSSEQVIDISGLLCLWDLLGPCANAVKDAQRTKTGDTTVLTLSLVWGTHRLPGRTAQVTRWYRELLRQLGAATFDAALS